MEQVWIDNKLVINNEGAVKAGTNSDNSVEIAKGLHPVKFVYLCNIGSRLAIMVEQPYFNVNDNQKNFTGVAGTQYFH